MSLNLIDPEGTPLSPQMNKQDLTVFDGGSVLGFDAPAAAAAELPQPSDHAGSLGSKEYHIPVQFNSVFPTDDPSSIAAGWDWLPSDEALLEFPFLPSFSLDTQEQPQEGRGTVSQERSPQVPGPTTLDQLASTAESHPPRVRNQVETNPERPWPTTRDKVASSALGIRDTICSYASVDIASEIKWGDLDNIPPVLDDIMWAKVEEVNFSPFCQDYHRLNTLGRPGAILDHLNESYFTKFHPLWPILHRATFHRTKKPSVLVLAVLMVGSLLSGCEGLAFVAEQIHQSLKRNLYGSLVSLKADDLSKLN